MPVKAFILPNSTVNRFFRFCHALAVGMIAVCVNVEVCAQTQIIDSLKNVLERHNDDTIGIRARIYLATEFSRTDLKKSRQYLYEGLAKSKSLKVKYGFSAIYSQFTTSYQNTGQLDSARKYLELLKEFTARNNTNDNLANYHLTAGLYFKNLSQFDQALPHMLEALNYMKTPKFEVMAAGQLLNIGNTYMNLGEVEKAARYLLDALQQFEKLKNKRGISFCLQSLGSSLIKLKRFDEAIIYFERSERLKEELKDSRGLISAWNGLGNAYSEIGKTDVALVYYDKALKQSRELKLQSDESKALFDIGVLQSRRNQKQKAKATLKEALPLARNRGDSLLAARIQSALISLEKNELNIEEVERALLYKLQQATIAADQNAIADVHFELAEHYSQHQRHEQAYQYLRKFQELSDTVRGRAVSLKFTELEQRYKHDQKEKEITLLKKDQQLTQAVVERQKADQQITLMALVSVVILAIGTVQYFRYRARLRRKEEVEIVRNNIARDLHDDIGSALSSINIMSQLAMLEKGNVGDQMRRISETSLRMMESMSDIVWSINPENDSLDKLIVKMKEFAQEILEPQDIQYTFEVDHDLLALKLDVEKRKNLFLIFKESVNNAAKYSESSHVLVRIEAQRGNLQLTVKDNGKGFETENVRRGNGLTNMVQRARSMKGRLTQIASPGNGTEIIAQLPIT